MGDGYDKREKGKRDKFIVPYMGKIYSQGATEIVSMGMEFLFADPVKLAKEDPEYFDFMIDLLRGIL